MGRVIIAVAVAMLAVSACAPIEHTQIVMQPVGQPLLAGQGDLVLRVDKQRNLENLFGASDIYGRKTNEGYSELRFAGVERDGTIVLFRKDVAIISNETTMSRSPFVSSFGSSTTTANATGSSFGNQVAVNGSARTNSSSLTIVPTSDFHVVVPPETVAIRIPKGTPQFPFEGTTVEVLGVTPVSLSYRVVGK